MLTSADETDLLIPLFGEGGGAGRFEPFLARLQRRTQANHAALVLESAAFAVGTPAVSLESALPDAALRPGRVYALAELTGSEPMQGDARILRLPGADPAWLLITRAEECRAADAALLSALAPYVGIALRQFRADQRVRAVQAAAATALDRAGAGWILLDGESRVTEVEQGLAQRLAAAGLRLRAGERLPGLGADKTPRAFVLSDRPRVDAVLLPGGAQNAAAMVLCRFARDGGERPEALFAQLSGLPPREAEFAVALARGGSIAAAGAALGLTLETARSYSKQIYAKLGLRGQADLVRRFYESGASLA